MRNCVGSSYLWNRAYDSVLQGSIFSMLLCYTFLDFLRRLFAQLWKLLTNLCAWTPAYLLGVWI